jgi:cytochrome oxidase assembly protein ShyY1
MSKHGFKLLSREDITKDGEEVLFDRGYSPMLRRDKDKTNVRKASGWIDHVAQVWFYNDANSPRGPRRLKRTKDTISRCDMVLEAFNAGESIAPYVWSGDKNALQE